ncbi:MAG: peptidase T [Oscillospiraceae bacterium]|nr:peptidase T [Oscillospiraceae bacterium]
MTLLERFLKYVKVHTASEGGKYFTIPSTERQFDLANMLAEEMKELGLQDVRVSEYCYVYGNIPATPGYENAPAIGFISHMDTAPDFCGENVKPQVIENYDGGDVVLGKSGKVLSVKNFPHLPTLKGRTLITTDGTTLLGADDKAGIAAIMTAAERIIAEGKPHGKICIGFTPDEEVGNGATKFDVQGFGAAYAYTSDGGPEVGVEFENFNAASAAFYISGFNVHPGSSKNTMVNAALLASKISSMLPEFETPRDTEQYEGFFHLTEIKGDVEKAEAHFIIRDHDRTRLEARKKTMQHIADILNEQYGEGTVELKMGDQYRNMREVIEKDMHLIEIAGKVMRDLGKEPVTMPVRGGTDGASLSFMGLPCPNIGTGGYAAHGPYEHVTLEGMEFVSQLIAGIAAEYAKR